MSSSLCIDVKEVITTPGEEYTAEPRPATQDGYIQRLRQSSRQTQGGTKHTDVPTQANGWHRICIAVVVICLPIHSGEISGIPYWNHCNSTAIISPTKYRDSGVNPGYIISLFTLPLQAGVKRAKEAQSPDRVCCGIRLQLRGSLFSQSGLYRS